MSGIKGKVRELRIAMNGVDYSSISIVVAEENQDLFNLKLGEEVKVFSKEIKEIPENVSDIIMDTLRDWRDTCIPHSKMSTDTLTKLNGMIIERIK